MTHHFGWRIPSVAPPLSRPREALLPAREADPPGQRRRREPLPRALEVAVPTTSQTL